jgi:hypothetical protein
MDLDIFLRKAEVKGYFFPKLDAGRVIYKMETLAGSDYSIESSPLERTPISLTVIRFTKNKDNKTWKEEAVAEICCRTLEEAENAMNQIHKLEEGSPLHPFDQLLSSTGMTFILKKKNWIIR